HTPGAVFERRQADGKHALQGLAVGTHDVDGAGLSGLQSNRAHGGFSILGPRVDRYDGVPTCRWVADGNQVPHQGIIVQVHPGVAVLLVGIRHPRGGSSRRRVSVLPKAIRRRSLMRPMGPTRAMPQTLAIAYSVKEDLRKR